MYCLFCVVLCTICLYIVLYYCHLVATQLQLNISYHTIPYMISYHTSCHIISYHIIYLTQTEPIPKILPRVLQGNPSPDAIKWISNVVSRPLKRKALGPFETPAVIRSLRNASCHYPLTRRLSLCSVPSVLRPNDVRRKAPEQLTVRSTRRMYICRPKAIFSLQTVFYGMHEMNI